MDFGFGRVVGCLFEFADAFPDEFDPPLENCGGFRGLQDPEVRECSDECGTAGQVIFAKLLLHPLCECGHT